MGNDCAASGMFFADSTKKLTMFFSNEMSRARRYMQKVTWNIEENDWIEMVSVSSLSDEDMRTNLNGAMVTACSIEICGFRLLDPKTVDSYSFEVDSLVGSVAALKCAPLFHDLENVLVLALVT